MCEGALPLPRSALGAVVDGKYHEGIFIADFDSMECRAVLAQQIRGFLTALLRVPCEGTPPED